MPQPPRLLNDLLDTLAVRVVHGSSRCPIQCVVADSREVVPGSLFVAVRGLQVDGHQFLGDALDRGAAAVVLETLPTDLGIRAQQEGLTVIQVSNTRAALATIANAYYQHPSRAVRLIGITGTNGKTTTSYIVESILQAAGLSVGVIGTVAYRFAEYSQAAPQTTPDVLLLQPLLAQMRQVEVEYAVMEVSSHALDQGRVDGCEFAACVFTNLSRDHYDYHASEEAYFAAKSRLFTMLPGQWHVLNLDDVYGQRLLHASRARVLTYALEREATLMPQGVDHGLDGIRFTVSTTKGILGIRSSLVGRHNVYNLLASIATALALDIDGDAIVEGIARLAQVPGRLERIEAGQDFHVFVDYAHTPDALEQVLRAVRTETTGRFIVVFGCGGDRDPGKRPLMGRVATTISDYAIVTSDNPRTEDPEQIIADIVVGIDASSAYTTIPDRQEAIHRAISMAQPRDTVVIAGKGHEDYQIIGSMRRHFDDREVAREALLDRS